MSKYCFPAVFSPDDGGYSVSFPDIAGCFTCGETLAEAVEMAEDALGLMLVTMEDDHTSIPNPSDMHGIAREENELVSLVAVDTGEYRKRISTRAIKKTLSIPQWLNTAAEAANLNFSQTLQEALIEKLHLA